MLEPQVPLILCMANAVGEEIALRIEPEDDFRTFLDKAKSILGFDVDINTITRNQPVSLDENIYQFFINTEQIEPDTILSQNLDPTLNSNDSVYILDDGTQIRASQIHFDNEDPPVDLTAEKIPFVKYADNDSDELDLDNVNDDDIKMYNIVESPVSRWSSQTSSPKSFVNSLPFKLVCNNTSTFEAQFSKYLEANSKTYTNLNPVANRNKSPRSVTSENYKNYDDNFNRNDVGYTRDEILNMFKDSPLASLPYESPVFEKRRHVRKTDPSRIYKSCNPQNYDDVVLIGDDENKDCFICGKYVENNMDKLYLFDNEDQKIHRSSPQRKTSRQLKIICESCLGENFKPCRMKGANQYLNPDEYLVIKNNQQYIFQKTKDFTYKCSSSVDAIVDEDAPSSKEKEKHEFVKVEIGSDGEIITKPIDNDPDSDDVIIVKDDGKDDSSSDVEIIEPQDTDDSVIDNLDEADEEVKEFLGKYHCDENTESNELKCRFCVKIFETITDLMDHSETHKHEYEDGIVFPCPLCDYGYANPKWLKGHLKAAHEKKEKGIINNSATNDGEGDTIKSPSASPIARRTRSANKKNDDNPTENSKSEETKQIELIRGPTEGGQIETTVKVEVKQESQGSSDDEIWIVQAADDDGELDKLLGAKNKNNDQENTSKETFKCTKCSQIFSSAEGLSSHKCRRRGRRPKAQGQPDNVLCVPTKEDFIKRAQGRLRPVEKPTNDLLVERPRKKKRKEPTSDPQIVTCHNCNESFTSKVRLKFHMQFHESTSMLVDGKYSCLECDNTSFDTETELFDHVHFQHDKRKRWQCPVVGCGKTFYLRATLTKHSRTHTDTRRYVCVTCGKRFLDKQTLDEHGVTHLQIKPFQCHICLKQLTRRSRLRMHLRAHEEELTPTLVLVCAVCSRAFRDQQDAQEHATRSTECIEEFAKDLKEEEDVMVQLSPTSGLVRHSVQSVDSPKLNEPIARQVDGELAEPMLSSLADEARTIIRVVEIEKAFRCEYCEDIFYLEDALNKHRLIHKGVKNPFTCHICKVTFATYSRCTTHKTTHGFYKRPLADAKQSRSEGPEGGPSSTGILGYGGFPVVKHFLCEDCGRSYLHWTYLQVHRRMKHANQNYLYKCSQCELTFPNSWSLGYHKKKIHGKSTQEDGNTVKATKEDYKIPCRDCDEILPNKTALYKHRKKEHSDLSIGDEKSGTFWYGRQADMLRSHHCDVCGRSFRTASMYNEHLRVHTGERPYPCDLCGVAFRRSTAMRNHRLIHTGVRAWACARCPKRFRIRSDLRTHMKLKHPYYIAVIEVVGSNPSPDEVMAELARHNIPQERVIEISKMSFSKGTRSLVPSCARALALLGHVPRTLACSRLLHQNQAVNQPARRGRGIAKNTRQPKILQRGHLPAIQEPSKYPITLGVTGEELRDADVQLLLRDGALVNGNQMVQLEIDDNVLTE
ncbi:zinc finger protein Xfin-like [Galleria mellonella]|uniref:Zinc finger protein Xfin-like n=1 Tax=Galleria mellonella TaxID=7137 RepID=A0ABM3N0C6_GALME|nr:zinc finger protein Xfin-like [Galleria mellonella]